jgi:hypothetical protein
MKEIRAIFRFFLIMIVFLGIVEGCNNVQASESTTETISKAIWSIVKTSPKNPVFKTQPRAELAGWIAEASGRHGIPGLLVTAIVYRESSFRPGAVGSARGEVGLMQVHGAAARGCELDTGRGQIDCGTKWLAACKQKCGSVERSLTAYAIGKCETDSKRVKGIVNSRIKLWERLKNGE